MKEKLLVIWILSVAALGFFFRHFWDCAVYALQKAVALSFIPLPGLLKIAAVICLRSPLTLRTFERVSGDAQFHLAV